MDFLTEFIYICNVRSQQEDTLQPVAAAASRLLPRSTKRSMINQDNMDLDLRYEDLPNQWPVCFLDACPRKGDCLRFMAGRTVPDDLTTACSVIPTVLRKPSCPLFQKVETVRAAAGFHHIFDEVKHRDIVALRHAILRYLGGRGTYYRYLHGERLLMPEQQQWIRDLFHHYGYTDELSFDGYKTVYRFF